MRLKWHDIVLYAALIGMEWCSLYVLLALVNSRGAGGRLSVPGLLLVYLVAFAFNLALRQLGWHRSLKRAINFLAWVITLLLVIKIQLYSQVAITDSTWLRALPGAFANILYGFAPELLVLLASAALWWMGRRLAYVRTSTATAVGGFQFWLAVILIVFFVAFLLESQVDNSVPLALGFFFFSLAGMSIAHAREGTGWLSGLQQGHWSGLLLVSIGIVIVLGLIIGLIATPDLLNLILVALKWVWGLIVRVFEFLVSLLPEPSPGELPPTVPVPQPEPSEEIQKWFTIPDPLLRGLRLGWEIMMLGIAVFALWRISTQLFGWLRRKLTTGKGEFEPIQGAFKADILGLLRRILFKLLRIRLPVHRGKEVEPSEVKSVRQLYRQFLRWAASHGYPRTAFQTPYEYLGKMGGLLPGSEEALRFITESYIGARYGQFSPSGEDLQRLRDEWQRLKQEHLQRPGEDH